MKALYDRVCRELGRLDFDALWPGFHIFPFALYDGETAVLEGKEIPCPEEFRGNTSISFEGRQIAIWNVGLSPQEDTARLASLLAHEMFHAFQMEQGETCWPDDLALACFSPTPEQLALKSREAEILARSGGLPEFKGLRELRRTLAGAGGEEEFKVETIEGTAQYIELSALGRLSPELYEQVLAQCRERLSQRETLLDVRRCAYDTGALLLMAAERDGLPFARKIGEETGTIYETAAALIREEPCRERPGPQEQKPWARLLEQRETARAAAIREFLSTPYREVKGEWRICGFDPMNLWRQGDVLYSTSYLCLRSQDGGQMPLPGTALLRMRPGSFNIAISYLLPK